jgi:hypothetical protein
VNRLAVELVKKKVDVYVVTYHDSWSGFHQGSDGVKAYRITDKVRPQINILTWMLSLNQEAERVSADIYYSVRHRVDVVDVHDWHFIPAAVTIKRAFGIPYVFSVDSIEPHRSRDSGNPLSLPIKSIEYLGVVEATRIIAKSEWMKQELKRYYNASDNAVDIASDSEKLADEVLSTYEKSLRVSVN